MKMHYIKSPDLGKSSLGLIGVILFGIVVVGVAVSLFLHSETSQNQEGASSSNILNKEDSDHSGASSDDDRLLEKTSKTEKLVSVAGGTFAGTPRKHDMIRGKVLFQDKTPAPFAEVNAVQIKTLNRAVMPKNYKVVKTLCDSSGTFVFDQLPLGAYTLVAVKDDKVGKSGASVANSFYTPNPHSRELEIILKESGTISGKVLDPSGAPIKDARVVPRRMEACFTLTDSQGCFKLNSLKAGLHDIIVSSPQWAPKLTEGVLTGNHNLRITLLPGAFIKGQVRMDGKPVAGVLIKTLRTQAIETLTQKDGAYSLGPLRDGWYSISAIWKNACAPTRTKIFLSVGDCIESVDFELRKTCRLMGRVVDKETNEPIEGVWFSVYPRGNISYDLLHDFKYARSNNKGEFLFPSLCPTEYVLSVKSAGPYINKLYERIISLKEGEVQNGINFDLEKGAAVTVLVTNSSGEPISNADVTIMNTEESDRRIRRSFNAPPPKAIELQNGSYVIEGLKPGVYRVMASKQGWITGWKLLALGQNKSPSSTKIVMSPAVIIPGKVKGPDNNPVQDAYVQVGDVSSGMTDENGVFTLENITPGNCNFMISAQGFVNYTTYKKIKEKPDHLEFTLIPEENGFISGFVMTDNNEPLSQALVTAYSDKEDCGCKRTALTKSDGSFRIEGLLNTPVELYVESSHGEATIDLYDLPINSTDIKIVVERYAQIKGRANSFTGEPLPRFFAFPANVDVEGADWFSTYRSRLYGQECYNGEFHIKQLTPGKYAVHVSTLNGEKGSSQPINLKPGDVVENVAIKLIKTGDLSGRVVDRNTRKPVANVNMLLFQKRKNNNYSSYFRKPVAVTDENGVFAIKNQAPGPVVLSAVHSDYCESEILETIVIEGQCKNNLEIQLDRGGAVFGGVLINNQGKAGVEVIASLIKYDKKRHIDEVMKQVHSGMGGNYRIDHLRPGEYKLRAVINNKGESCSMEKKVLVANGAETRCDLIFSRGGLVGTARFFGKPAKNVRVWAGPVKSKTGEKMAGGSGAAKTDQNGAYAIENLPPGKYKVIANLYVDDCRFSTEQQVDINNSIVTCNLEFGDGELCSISGHIYKNGVPVPNYPVSCVGEKFRMSINSDSNGYFHFSNVIPGEVTLDLYSSNKVGDGYQDRYITYPVTTKPGDEIHKDISLCLGSCEVIGTVLENQVPTKYSEIKIERIDKTKLDFKCMVETSDKGKYACSDLEEGIYKVALFYPHYLERIVELKSGQSVVADFACSTGKATLTGVINNYTKNKNTLGDYRVFVFKPGACKWKKDDVLNLSSHIPGMTAEADYFWNNGAFHISNLYAESVDVVGLFLEGDMIKMIHIKPVLLVNDKEVKVSLNLN